jgi:hypothetical protein
VPLFCTFSSCGHSLVNFRGSSKCLQVAKFEFNHHNIGINSDEHLNVFVYFKLGEITALGECFHQRYYHFVADAFGWKQLLQRHFPEVFSHIQE